MYIAHFAPAFIAAAAYSRGPKLGTYFVAAQLVDWGFFIFAWIGIEKVRMVPGITAMNPLDLYFIPFTHSLLGTAVWAVTFGIIVAIWSRDKLGGALAGLVVASHWLLDWLVHRPDLTIAGGEHRHGLGLWNHPEIAIPLEIALLLGAFLYYVLKSRGPAMPPLILISVLMGFQMINWFGPEPTVAGPVFYGQALLSFAIATGLAVWVAKNRYFTQRGGLAAPAL